MQVALIDYGSGNLRSAEKALARAGQDVSTSISVTVTDDPKVVQNADRIVLPGVGAFADCRAGLAGLSGMDEALHQAVIEKGRPFLGICVGMQLCASRGLEFDITEGLDWIPGDVAVIEPNDAGLKIPHMGWNTLNFPHPETHPVLQSLPTSGGPDDIYVYFVHSFAITPKDPAMIQATTDYGGKFAAAVGRDNIIGTQFHPEKSQGTGQKLLQNFLTWTP